MESGRAIVNEDKKEFEKLLDDYGKGYEKWAKVAAIIVFIIVVATLVYSLF